jgi:hypothetical protein
MELNLKVLSETLAVCRLSGRSELPAWALGRQPFCSITRTPDELSIICPEAVVPAGVQCEKGWRAIQFEGPFDFNVVGVLSSVAEPLAAAGISILALATYDTDYVLVKEARLGSAMEVLASRGHNVRRE